MRAGRPRARGMGGPFGAADDDQQDSFGGLLETFGAVPVGGRNLHKLLAAGESVLLYPGGVREALKLKGEKYEIFWPSRPEFVRMAAKFGATIVPFAAVGAEDGVNQLLDGRDLLAAPILGPALAAQQKRMAKARRGVSATDEVVESMVAPLVSFNPPSRFYFLFGRPLKADPAMASDRAACDALYARVRADVEGGLGYLLRKREQDPYKGLLERLVYEASWGGGRKAPTFRP